MISLISTTIISIVQENLDVQNNVYTCIMSDHHNYEMLKISQNCVTCI